MNIKQKLLSKFKVILTVAAIVLVASAGAGALFVLNNEPEVSADPTSTAEKSRGPGKSLFSFTGVEGWWQGATSKTSMALFEKEKGCFTSVEYKAGTVDADAELEKEREIHIKDGRTVTSLGTQVLTMQVSSGPQKYELHQSAIATPPGALKVKGAQEFGYLQLSGGYIKIMGYCDVFNDLPATVAALQAIKYKHID